jgi:hypothetical protein
MGLRWRDQAATENYRPVLSSERALHKITNPQLSDKNFKEKEKLLTGPECGLTPGLTVSRKITLTL